MIAPICRGSLLVLVTSLVTSYELFLASPMAAASTPNVGHAPKFVHQPGNELVKVGEPKTIECPVEAEPEPEVSWFKDGQLVGSQPSHLELTGNELMFISISERDSGDYFCRATNLMGSVESERFKLQIQTSLHDPQISFEPQLASVQADHLIAFTCSIGSADSSQRISQDNSQNNAASSQLANPGQIFFRKNNERLPVRWIDSSLNLSAGDNLNQIKSLGERFLARALSLHQYQLLIVATSHQLDDNSTFTCLFKPPPVPQQSEDVHDSSVVMARESNSVKLRVELESRLELDANLASPIDNLANSRAPHQISAQKDANSHKQLTHLQDSHFSANNVTSTILSSQNLANLYELLKPALVVGAIFVLIANTLLWAQWIFAKWRRRSQYKKHHHQHYSSAGSGSSSATSSMLDCDPVLKSLMGRTLSGHSQQQPVASQLLQHQLAHQSSSSLLLANKALGKKYRSYRDNMRCKVAAATTTNANELLHHQQPWNVASSADLIDAFQFQGTDAMQQMNQMQANLPNLYNQSLAAREQARNLLLQVNEQAAHMRSLNNIYSGQQQSSNLNTARDFLDRLTGLRSSVGAPTNNAIKPNVPVSTNASGSVSASQSRLESHQLWSTASGNKKMLINQAACAQFRPNQLIDGQQTLVTCSDSTTKSVHSPDSARNIHQQQQQYLNNANHQHLRRHETRLQSSSNHYSTIDNIQMQTPESNTMERDQLQDGEACYEELDQPRDDCASELLERGQDVEQALIITSGKSMQRQHQQSNSSRNSSTRTTSTFVSSGLALDLNQEAANSRSNSSSRRRSKRDSCNHQQTDQLSPYAVSSILCTGLPGNASNKLHQQQSPPPPPPPPMTSEAMRALNEQFNINQLMLLENQERKCQQDASGETDQTQPVRQLIANFDIKDEHSFGSNGKEQATSSSLADTNNHVIPSNSHHLKGPPAQLKPTRTTNTKHNSKR